MAIADQSKAPAARGGPRIAILGCGLMGRWHAHAAASAGATIVAAVDADQSRADALARRHSGAKSTTDLAAVLEHVDIVHLCTPSSSHVPIATQVIEAGRHVVIEKPIAPTAADTETLLRLASLHHVQVCPVHQFVFQEGMQQAIVNLAAIGPLLDVRFTMCSAGAQGRSDAERRRVALEILPHPLSILARLAAGDLAKAAWSIVETAPGELRAHVVLGEWSTSILISMSGRPTTNRVELIGGGGSIEVDLFHGFSVTSGGEVSRRRKILAPFARAGFTATSAAANLARRTMRREPAYPGLRPLFERFYRATTGDEATPFTRDEILAVARTADVFVDALASGR